MHIRLAYDDYHGFTVLVVKVVVWFVPSRLLLALVNELLDEYEPVHLDELMDDGTGDDSHPTTVPRSSIATSTRCGSSVNAARHAP